jgi:replicative superfamily II helicase
VGHAKLREMLLGGAGVAFHHAGIAPEDRATVEGLFLRGHVRVLCSTSTLAGASLLHLAS